MSEAIIDLGDGVHVEVHQDLGAKILLPAQRELFLPGVTDMDLAKAIGKVVLAAWKLGRQDGCAAARAEILRPLHAILGVDRQVEALGRLADAAEALGRARGF